MTSSWERAAEVMVHTVENMRKDPDVAAMMEKNRSKASDLEVQAQVEEAVLHLSAVGAWLRRSGPLAEAVCEALGVQPAMQAIRAEAWDEGHHAGVWNATSSADEPFMQNPYRPTP